MNIKQLSRLLAGRKESPGQLDGGGVRGDNLRCAGAPCPDMPREEMVYGQVVGAYKFTARLRISCYTRGRDHAPWPLAIIRRALLSLTGGPRVSSRAVRPAALIQRSEAKPRPATVLRGGSGQVEGRPGPWLSARCHRACSITGHPTPAAAPVPATATAGGRAEVTNADSPPAVRATRPGLRVRAAVLLLAARQGGESAERRRARGRVPADAHAD